MGEQAEKKDTAGQRINKLTPGKFLRLDKIAQGGALEARRLTSGAVMFYWRYTHASKTERIGIGVYDPMSPPKSLDKTDRGFSVAAAKRACELLGDIHRAEAENGGYRAVQERKKAEKVREQEEQIDRQRHTLKAMLIDYCDHLEAKGRRSHSDARSIFKVHVFEPWPQIAQTPACEVTTDQVVDMIARTLDAGLGRTSNKLRSYLMAAYRVALTAHQDPGVPRKMKDYKVKFNPARETVRQTEHDRADKNPLTLDEMRSYWQAIQPMDGIHGAILRLHLLTGGQRIEQLIKLKRTNVSNDAITLYDGKGRPGKGPRVHTVPLIDLAREAIAQIGSPGEFAISTDEGKSHISASMLTNWAKAVPHGIENFKVKRIRSGVETLLAAAGISRETRGYLQSHGLTGVQARHYDDYDYLPEKKKALLMLYRTLESKATGNIIAIRKKAKTAA